MYWFILILCSIPIYGLIGWLVFDTGENAAESVVDTLVLALKEIFFYPFFYLFFERDMDRAASAMGLGIFLIACSAVTYGEHFLIQKYLLAKPSSQEQAAELVPGR